MARRKANANEEQLEKAFGEICRLLEKYSPPLEPREVKTDKPQYHLWSLKNVEIDGRKKKEVYFAGAIVQKGYVGFYYMPVYAEAEMKKVFEPELLGLLKGKSCFHVREMTPGLKKQIRAALEAGFRMYRKRGWV